MAITTLMATFVALHWRHNPWIVDPINGAFLALDRLFFASTSTKIFDGGWYPLMIAGVIAFSMLTWRTGERIMDSVRLDVRQRSKDFIAHLQSFPPRRLPGTAVVLGRMAKGIPLALTQNLKHNCCLHAHVLLVAVAIAETPRVTDEQRGTVTPLGDGVTRVELSFGFMEQADVPAGLRTLMEQGKIESCDLSSLTYYTGHETIIPAGRRRVWRLGEKKYSPSCIKTHNDRELILESEQANHGDWR